MPEKVKLKNGRGEFVYPVIDPNDAGGGSGGRAIYLFVSDDGDIQNIECYDMKNMIESHGETVPAPMTAEDFCQAFTLGGSIDLFVELIHDNGQDYQTEGIFVSRWTSGNEKNSMNLIGSIMSQNVGNIANCIGEIAWPGIFRYESGAIFAVPANFYINMGVDGETGAVSFSNVHFTANSVQASDAKSYDFALALNDLSLFWTDYNDDYRLYKNDIDALQDSVSVDPFWGWYCENDLIPDLFNTGINTISTSVDHGETQMTFKFVGYYGEDKDGNSKYLFNGVNCNKSLILTEARTDENDDPRGQNWGYPYISNYEIKDNGGSDGDSTTAWYELPIYNYTVWSDEDFDYYGLDRSMSLASLWIPYNKKTGMCIYTSWQDLMANTEDVNALFEYLGTPGSGNDAITYNGPNAFIKNKNRYIRQSGAYYYVATWDSTDIHQIKSITEIPLDKFQIAQLIPMEKAGAIGAVMATSTAVF